MFKKLKDKLAEEVKSSPQRIQLFAQAAQAAVTSASSSISDITNSDLFSIGDNDSQQARQSKPPSSPTSQHKSFQDVARMQSPAESMDFTHEIPDGQRQRRLSNSSFASDISFRLPNYETPSMYHLQSDMEVSASEADDRGFSGGPVTLDRVTKEQLYAAYKRTQERYKKYRTQYGDLARHYKLLERENAKARSVLVETQDKALRRISELKEQCSLEQSAKAHLEKALRVEMEEKNMKIEALNTKVQLLQNNTLSDINSKDDNADKKSKDKPENEVQLISLDNESNSKVEDSGSETSSLNIKIEKMEQLMNKYKESLKNTKEKNSQLTIDVQILSKELENKDKQIQDLKNSEKQLCEAKEKILELNILNEELQNQINSYDFKKTKELSTLELDLQRANDEIAELRGKIEIFNKREEEYAISLAENKLSIHKELEDKETEIKSLKNNLSLSKQEIQSLKIVVDDYKNSISVLEEEKVKLSNDCAELNTMKNRIRELDSKLQELSKKSQTLEQLKMKSDEEYKCLQLQLKQETAEKLAMIDRNAYLETKNAQLLDENTKKNTKINNLENQLQVCITNKNDKVDNSLQETDNHILLEEMNLWKEKCSKLELEIQEEREELVKLQAEIEKLLSNHELIQTQNAEFRTKITSLTSECTQLHESAKNYKTCMHFALKNTLEELKLLKKDISAISHETKTTLHCNGEGLISLTGNINSILSSSIHNLLKDVNVAKIQYDNLKLDYDKLQNTAESNYSERKEHFDKIDNLQKENETLQIKLNDNESQMKLINEQLDVTKDQYNTLKHDYDKLQATVALSHTERNENFNKIDELQKEIDSLQIKLLNNESQMKLINEKLENYVHEYECSVEKIKSLNTEKNELMEKLNKTEETSQQFQSMLDSEKALHKTTTEKLKILDMDKQKLETTVQALEVQNEKLNIKIEQLIQEHKFSLDEMKVQHEKILKQKEELIKNMTLQDQYQSDSLEKLQKLETEKNDLNDIIKTLELKNNKLQTNIGELTKKNEDAVSTLSDLNNQIDEKAIALEKLNQNQISLQNEIAQYTISCNKISELEIEKQDLTEKLRLYEDSNRQLNIELEGITDKHKATKIQIEEINTSLANKSNECVAKQAQINDLEEQIRKLTQENITLKSETVNFDSNIKILESEIDNIKLSHAKIETEKDRLNRIIEEIEGKEKENVLKTDKDSQTESNNEEKVEKEKSAVLENKWVMEHKQAMYNTASLNLKKENLEDLYEQYSILKINNDSLKDENRRLQSDIEGLQSYLTKISKENSVLNDKLRELIATGDHSTDNYQLSSDVKELRNEIQIDKEKINDLQRENSLLIEENLELRDQLQSQNYAKPADTKIISVNNDEDLECVKLKYNDLLQANSTLEKQNIELEQINKSVNGNMQQLQDKNERLKLSNEKLERRLDEALVSLRHLHSLQENTELEYLRNILYEYLTGSGTHSVTLAKVLAAIVKFDDVQTKLILQKEKERQGFLRQLGII